MTVSGTFEVEARRAAMSEELASHGTLNLNEAAKKWDKHPMTIRRDFDSLVRAGMARRIRGGLVAIGGDDFTQRRYQNAGAKRLIAQKMLTLITPGSTIALDASTTVHALAEVLSDIEDTSVITNGFSAFQALHGRDGIHSYLTGGQREEENLSLVGPLAVLCIEQFTLDLCFLSAMNLDTTFGTSELTLEQVAVKKAMVDASDKAVLAIDSSKFETRAKFRSLPLSEFDVLITELNPADPRLDPYRDQVELII